MATKEFCKEDRCKRIYNTEAEAAKAAKAARVRTSDAIYPYPCSWAGGHYHIGHSKGSAKRGRRTRKSR